MDNKTISQYYDRYNVLWKTKIQTVDEYVAFVGQWKQVEKDVVHDIRAARANKNAAKAIGNYSGCNAAWAYRQKLRFIARAMYAIRIDRKQRLKDGVYVDTRQPETV